ncbi:DNA/RNA non-specific endonuclease [Schleiferilactobacillus shenzhenensis]|uniref:Endonuclease n=1 Tax=Schleiferilactobacillus shenzhenensis LY-73 TaxID=1231336 RepID=U4TTX1_9LACO|nr:endonuclease [Schleiferilactobacillus shenzhenensis LY-73]
MAKKKRRRASPRRGRKQPVHVTLGGLIVIALIAFLLARFGGSGNTPSGTNAQSTSTPTSQVTGSSAAASTGQAAGTSSSAASSAAVGDSNWQATYAALAKLTFQSGNPAAINVNGGKSTLTMSSWRSNHIDYGNLDSLNRTTTVTAYLQRSNLGKSAGRPAQKWQPTGWHQEYRVIDGDRIPVVNRGHLIAYTMTFNLNSDGVPQAGAEGSSDNPKNLATQTEYSNQKTMQIYEEAVRDALERGARVIYQVTTVFRGSELMPRGYWSQAVSSDRQLNFNVYIWNVEPQLQFDYATGRNTIDRSMSVTAVR